MMFQATGKYLTFFITSFAILLLAADAKSHSTSVSGVLMTTYAASTSSTSAAPQTILTTQTTNTASTSVSEVSLVSLSAGALIVKKPQEYDTSWSSIWLLDERPDSGWATPRGVTGNQVIVIALPERTVLKSLIFDTGSVDGDDGRGAKDIVVEVSDTNEESGFKKIAEVSLQDKMDNQRFPVAAEIPGRWVRLIIKNNHGSPKYVELMDFRATGKQLTHTPLPSISGTYNSNYNDFHIRQEGTSVTGCYEYDQGLVAGGIDSRALNFTWRQSNSKGPAVMVFSPDGKQMVGVWWDDKGSGRGLWNATKKTDEVGSCSNWTGGVQEQIKKDLEEFGRVRIYGINFDFNSDRIKDESKPTLDKVVAILRAKADWKITIEGHTDAVGSAEYNQQLSERRANAVKSYLVAAGIAPSRLKAMGFGFSKPIASNDTTLGRAQNRRVELLRQ